jgi:hypothetical protein
MKPIHINDIKTSNRNNTQGRITNNNPRTNTKQRQLLQTTLSILVFVSITLLIFNYVPDTNNYKALVAMVWTSIYCVWVMIYDTNKLI